jgi:hypothetical protein
VLSAPLQDCKLRLQVSFLIVQSGLCVWRYAVERADVCLLYHTITTTVASSGGGVVLQTTKRKMLRSFIGSYGRVAEAYYVVFDEHGLWRMFHRAVLYRRARRSSLTFGWGIRYAALLFMRDWRNRLCELIKYVKYVRTCRAIARATH